MEARRSLQASIAFRPLTAASYASKPFQRLYRLRRWNWPTFPTTAISSRKSQLSSGSKSSPKITWLMEAGRYRFWTRFSMSTSSCCVPFTRARSVICLLRPCGAGVVALSSLSSEFESKAKVRSVHVVRPALGRIGVAGKQIGWHSFRHSLATSLRSLGVDIKVAQELMRHSSCRTTLDIYTRAVDQQRREASLKVMELMLPLEV
jgi:hypothetical protein